MKYIIQNCWTYRTWQASVSEARFYATLLWDRYSIYKEGNSPIPLILEEIV